MSYDMKLSDLFFASQESVECKYSVLPRVPFYPAIMVIALYFCDGAQFTQTFACMHSLNVVPMCPMI